MGAMVQKRDELQLLKEREVGRLLAASPGCLRRWRATGEGPPWIRVGKRLIRYDLAALRRWISEQADRAK
jgi:predicted DNA-binding transcriptional regulator AlpA